MKPNTKLQIVAACGIVALAPAVHAHDDSSPQAQVEDTFDEPGRTKITDADKPKAARQQQLEVGEVMRITQNAMTHVAAAERALDRGDTDAAESALEKSERALSRLYNASEQQRLLGQFDQAIRQADESTTSGVEVDLAPLMAKVTSYRAFLDPEVRAQVKDAQRRAEQGDAEGAEEALRLARNRVAIDMAFVPIEAAYTRVLAAQQVLSKGKPDEAARLLEDVPIVVSQVRISQPLVPIRFKLHAAAEAVEAGNLERSQQLLSEVDRNMQELVELSSGDKQLHTKLSQISDDIEQLTQRVREGDELNAGEIRALAKRTRDLGKAEPMRDVGEKTTTAPMDAPMDVPEDLPEDVPEDVPQPG